ncbi:11907_t:CDS:2 [Entrophospora sp. SA101]|nr:11907_t:CDS:2 [Entrophospora sp. SA101]
MTYRNLLRSSSMREPRDPLLKIKPLFSRFVFPFANLARCVSSLCIVNNSDSYAIAPAIPRNIGSEFTDIRNAMNRLQEISNWEANRANQAQAQINQDAKIIIRLKATASICCVNWLFLGQNSIFLRQFIKFIATRACEGIDMNVMNIYELSKPGIESQIAISYLDESKDPFEADDH